MDHVGVHLHASDESYTRAYSHRKKMIDLDRYIFVLYQIIKNLQQFMNQNILILAF